MQVFDAGLDMVLNLDHSEPSVKQIFPGLHLRAWSGVCVVPLSPGWWARRFVPRVVIQREIDRGRSELFHARDQQFDVIGAVERTEGGAILQELITGKTIKNAFRDQYGSRWASNDPQGFIT